MHSTFFPRPDTHALDESHAAPGPSSPTEPPTSLEIPGAAFSGALRSLTAWLILFCATGCFVYWSSPTDAMRHDLVVLMCIVFGVVMAYAMLVAAYVVGRFVDFVLEDLTKRKLTQRNQH